MLQVAEEDAGRPAVGDQVEHAHRDEVAGLGQPQQRRPPQWTFAEVERAAPLVPEDARLPWAAPLGRLGRKVGESYRNVDLGFDPDQWVQAGIGEHDA
jgi:hypothetical protein